MRVHFSFTGDETLLQDVDRAKELLRHKYPYGRLEAVFTEALSALLDRIDPERRLLRKARRCAGSGAGAGLPRRRGRRRAIPRRVKDAVWRRDGGQCAFTAPDGRRCGSAAGLEIDHVQPLAHGGAKDDLSNLRLLCRAHNDIEARRAFGDAHIDAAIGRRRGRQAPGSGRVHGRISAANLDFAKIG